MTTFYPNWDEANRNRTHGQTVKMGPNGNGVQMYYVADIEPMVPELVEGSEDDAFDIHVVDTVSLRDDDEIMYIVRRNRSHVTHYVVHVTLEADMPTEPTEHPTMASADNHARAVTAILSGTTEPQPAHVTHDAQGSTYTTSGHHEVFGEWSVDVTVRDVVA